MPKRKCKFNSEIRKNVHASELGEMKIKENVLIQNFDVCYKQGQL
jgi:hypothetical protein